MQLLVWVRARQSFIEKKTAARHDRLSWRIRCGSRAGSLDPANHDEVAVIASPPDQAAAPSGSTGPFTKKDYYHAPGMKPDLDALQRNVALMKDLGFMRSDIDVKKYSDLQPHRGSGCAD